MNLATFFHFWGPVDAAAPYELPGMNPTNCLSGNCSQWNVGFASVDTQFLKKSGDGVNAVATPNPGDPCPMLNTDYIVENYVSPQTYLRLASEIMNPDNPYYGAGDHDGLCEANEKCIYNPNFGAYQGHGSLAQCAYSGTTVSGVSMYFYSNNGF